MLCSLYCLKIYTHLSCPLYASVQLSIHRVDSKVRRLSPVIHSSSRDSPPLSREAAAAVSSGLTTALSDLWLALLGAGAW